ncbi:Nucleolar complex protein 3, partial [Danaus plexippus plexippus]
MAFEAEMKRDLHKEISAWKVNRMKCTTLVKCQVTYDLILHIPQSPLKLMKLFFKNNSYDELCIHVTS